MKKEELRAHYSKCKQVITTKLASFKKLSPEQHFHEFLFCTLTPQSNAHRCWSAVEEIVKLHLITKQALIPILQTRTRFHKNKASYILKNLALWPDVQKRLQDTDRLFLRNWLAENINGYGLKEAGHFLRNIGCSDNQVAILDRHILRNLAKLKVISPSDLRIKNKAHYLELEKQFLSFSQKINIPLDHLDLLFWSHETGEIFK